MDAEGEGEGEGEGDGGRKPPLKVVSPSGRSGGGNRLIWTAIVVAVGLILAYAAGLVR